MKRTPLKRGGRIKPKAKKAMVGKVTGKIRLDAKGMVELRAACYDRSRGQCEMIREDTGRRCPHLVGWITGELHHKVHRSLGGSDDMQNCIFVCKTCHHDEHNPKAVTAK